jgi:hypothetical protein
MGINYSLCHCCCRPSHQTIYQCHTCRKTTIANDLKLEESYHHVLYELPDSLKNKIPGYNDIPVFVIVTEEEYSCNRKYYSTLNTQWCCSSCYSQKHEKIYKEWKQKHRELMASGSILVQRNYV